MNAICAKCGTEKKRVKKGKAFALRCRPCEARYQRENYQKNIEIIRARKAKWMAEARKDPAKRAIFIESQRRCYENGGKDRARIRLQAKKEVRPIWYRLHNIRRLNKSITEADLLALWERQKGVCALTGRSISFADADIDHIIPKSRGGLTELSNLRWTWSRANEAKGNMTDDEFIAMCSQIAEWIGRQIMSQPNRKGA